LTADAATADLAAVAVPLHKYRPSDLVGKIVIDAKNYWAPGARHP
jgi:predicted dinucleotide-binding enzyme